MPKHDNKKNNSGFGPTPAWQQLESHAQLMGSESLASLLSEAGRYEKFSRELNELVVDFSRCMVSGETLDLLESLAQECDLQGEIQRLFAGAIVNETEGRAALHTALRGSREAAPDIAAKVSEQLESFLTYADSIRNAEICGSAGERFRTVINIGIGGSDLGPRLVARALADWDEPVTVHFVAGVDGIELADALNGADPATTLFIVCSKTFTTLETRVNADAARKWILNHLPDEAVAEHFAAISTNDDAMDEFGIARDRRFRIWDWVGGRYSVWSAIGLAAAIAIGSEKFREFLSGAREMDEHFLKAPFRANIPVLLGMIGIWNQNFLGAEASVVLPYDQRLENLPDYLQQLYMESQGKLVTTTGDDPGKATGKAVWGAPGSHAQHSFAQWLHQGNANVVVEYIGVINGPAVQAEQGRLFALANMIAQAEALAFGQDAEAVSRDLAAAGLVQDEIERLLPHKVHPGSRASFVLMLKNLEPHNLGVLLAMYEHRVFVQSVIWGINPFDQWGVELGKARANLFAKYLAEGEVDRLPGAGKLVLNWTES